MSKDQANSSINTNSANMSSNAMEMKLPGMRGGRGNRQQEVEKAKDGKKTVKRLLTYFNKEIFMVVALMLAVLLLVVCQITIPKLQSNAIDLITVGQFGGITKVLIIMLLVYLVQGICTFFQARFGAILSQKIVKRMREDLFDCIVNLPLKYIDSKSCGDIMSRMTNDVENVSNTISQSLSTMFSGVMTVIGTVIMMFLLCAPLAALSCTTVILTLVTTNVITKAMRKMYRMKQSLLGNLNGTVEEMVTGYMTVVAYNRQEDICKEFDDVSDHLRSVSIFADSLSNCMGPVMNFINNVGFVIIAAFGGYFAIHGIISVGLISAFIIYAKQFGRPIDELAQVYGQIQTAIAGAERVFEILDEELEDKSGEQIMDDFEGNITFDHVDFSYVKGKKVLHDFNLTVKSGEKIALVGATGSGKTTVVNLLMRFYDIDQGNIMIDGVNIKDISCDNLRKNTAIVLQDTVLFADTIRNNIKYSNQNATDEDMIEAARLSNCDRMIVRLPKNYDAVLVKGGENISQGQRQLLSIARAFLAKPKILILDEATSSVDTRTEKKIQDAMVRLMNGRTSLIIAHRLSTIQDADKIVVLDQGRIVEIGDHETLLAQKGKYYELYMTQFAGVAI